MEAGSCTAGIDRLLQLVAATSTSRLKLVHLAYGICAGPAHFRITAPDNHILKLSGNPWSIMATLLRSIDFCQCWPMLESSQYPARLTENSIQVASAVPKLVGISAPRGCAGRHDTMHLLLLGGVAVYGRRRPFCIKVARQNIQSWPSRKRRKSGA